MDQHQDGRGHHGKVADTRRTLVTELAESGAGDQTIMDIVGHVSRQLPARYTHIRIEARRTALESIVSQPVPVPQAPQPPMSGSPPRSSPSSRV